MQSDEAVESIFYIPEMPAAISRLI